MVAQSFFSVRLVYLAYAQLPIPSFKPSTGNLGWWAAVYDCNIQHDSPLVEDELLYALVHTINKNLEAEEICKMLSLTALISITLVQRP